MKLEEEQMSSTLALAISPLRNITLVLTHVLEGLTLNLTLTLTLIALTHVLEGPHRGAEQAGEASPTGGALSCLLLFPGHICPCCRARLRSWVHEPASPRDPPRRIPPQVARRDYNDSQYLVAANKRFEKITEAHEFKKVLMEERRKILYTIAQARRLRPNPTPKLDARTRIPIGRPSSSPAKTLSSSSSAFRPRRRKRTPSSRPRRKKGGQTRRSSDPG